MKTTRIFPSESCHFSVVKFSIYLNTHVFVMKCSYPTLRIIHVFDIASVRPVQEGIGNVALIRFTLL